MMTSCERVVAALNQQPTDRVPIHHLGFSSDVASALLGREAFVGGGIQMWREADAWWRGEDAHVEFRCGEKPTPGGAAKTPMRSL